MGVAGLSGRPQLFPDEVPLINQGAVRIPAASPLYNEAPLPAVNLTPVGGASYPKTLAAYVLVSGTPAARAMAFPKALT